MALIGRLKKLIVFVEKEPYEHRALFPKE